MCLGGGFGFGELLVLGGEGSGFFFAALTLGGGRGELLFELGDAGLLVVRRRVVCS